MDQAACLPRRVHHVKRGLGPYSASRTALEMLARCRALEMANTKTRVNLFNPGPVRTHMRSTLMPGEDPMTLDMPEQVAEFTVELS